MHKTFFLFLLLSCCNFLNAQNNFKFDRYGINEGFFPTEAFHTSTTSNGMIWVSTPSGLIRYNSKTFKKFSHNINDSSTIADNYCKAMAIDKRDFIWLASGDNLDVFDTKTETVRHIKFAYNKSLQKQVKIKPICFYYDTKNDVLFIGTFTGVYMARHGEVNLQHISSLSPEFNINDEANAITMDNQNNLYFGSNNNVHICNLKSNTRTDVLVNKTITNAIYSESDIAVTSLYFFENKLWIGLFVKGLLELNVDTKKSTLYTYTDNTKNGMFIYNITSVTLPKYKDLVWLTTYGFGLTTFNIITKKFEHFKNDLNHSPYGVEGNLYHIFNQKNNALWVGSSSGLYKLDFTKQLFTPHKINLPDKKNMIFSPGIIELEKTSKGIDETIWFHVPYVGTYRYDLQKKQTLQLPLKVQKYFDPLTGMTDFIIDKKNILWVANIEKGFLCYNINTNTIIKEIAKPVQGKYRWVQKIHEDNKQNIWLCTTGGLFQYDKNTNTIEEKTEFNKFLQEKSISLYMEGITHSSDGNLWVTVDGSNEKKSAIVKFNPLTKKSTILFNEATDLPKNNPAIILRGVAITKNNELFAVLRGYGLLYYKNTNKSQFEFLTEANNLNDTYINQLIVDEKQNVWCIGTSNLFYYNSKNKNFINYINTNLAISTKFEASFTKSANTSKFYVSSLNGIAEFDGVNETNHIEKPALLFDEFMVYNKLIASNMQSGQTIKLKHDENVISISFSLLSYTNSQENKYQWKLEEIEKEWHISNDNTANYSGLPPGRYTLLVKAANNNGIWTTSTLKLKIIIQPPFYKTWWFILLSLCLVGAIVYYLIKLRVKRIKEKYLLQNKIAADLHDEVGSTLTSINILSNISKQAIDTEPLQVKKMLEKISSQSKTVQQNISDIVWSIRPDNDKGESLLVRIREFATQTLEPLNIKFTLEVDDDIANAILNTTVRRELLLLYKEAINNIIKHSGANKVNIEFKKVHKQMILTIQDNGTWKGNNSGSGTKTMAERAKSLQGTLEIENNHIGTSVKVILPVT